MFFRLTKARLLILIVVGVFLCIFGFILGNAVFPGAVNDKIDESVRLEKNTIQYDRFIRLPVHLQFKIYLFNVINPDGIMNGEKPQVEERGPYVYKQFRRKHHVKLYEDQVEYNQSQYYEFDAFESFPYKEDDKITMLNVALNGVFQVAEKKFPNFMSHINSNWPTIFPDTKTLFHTVSVADILFNNYIFCDPKNISTIVRLLCSSIQGQPLRAMKKLEDGSSGFSFFGYKHENHDKRYLVGRGIKDVETLGHIYQWNNNTRTSYWKNEGVCNKVGGTDGSIFPPHSKKNRVFYVFNTDICRTVALPFRKEIEYKGVPGYRNEMARETLNRTPENECFCINETKTLYGENECLPNGFADLFNCQGAPVILSLPHFLWADDEYTNTVSGLEADEEKHITFFEYEPDTGTPLRGSKRVQLNMVIRKIDKINITENITPAIMPFAWIDESFELPQDLVDELYNSYLSVLPMLAGIMWLHILLGFTIITVSILCYMINQYKKKNQVHT